MAPGRTVVFTLLFLPVAAHAHRCDFSKVPGVVWWGTDTRMTVPRFVSYMAPIFWFSPDEPSLAGASGPNIRIRNRFRANRGRTAPCCTTR